MNYRGTRMIKTGNSAKELEEKLGKNNIFVKNAKVFEAKEL